MEHINTNYQLELEILTPVHIGAGKDKDWVHGLDFIQQSNEIIVLNKDAIYADLDSTQMRPFLRLLENNKPKDIIDFLENNFDLEDITSEKFNFDTNINVTEIKTQIRDGNGHTYIPGSSIKGAINTILFQYLYKNVSQGSTTETLNQDLLGSFDRSLSRYIKPSDANTKAINPTELLQVDVFNLVSSNTGWEGKFEEGLKITAEHFRPSTCFQFRFSIADGLLQYVKNEEIKSGQKLLPTYSEQTIEKNGIDFIFKIANNHSIDFLRKEIEFFEKYDRKYLVQDTLSALRKLLAFAIQAMESNNQCLLRLGAGGGFHSVTGDWRFKDHIYTVNNPDSKNLAYSRSAKTRVPARYKSRKTISVYDTVPGFVLVKFAGDNAHATPIILTEKKVNIPFISNEIPIVIPSPIVTLIKPKIERSDVNLEAIDENTVFTAQVTDFKSGFYQVFLFIAGRNDYAQMTLGIHKKTHQLENGDIIKVKIANRNKDGRIMQVSFIP
jgi:CRISPR type III-A-associated RAMP protein Csm5